MSHCLIFFLFSVSCPRGYSVFLVFDSPYSLACFFPPLVVCPLYLSFLHDRPDRTNHVFSFIFHVFFFVFERRYIYVMRAGERGNV